MKLIHWIVCGTAAVLGLVLLSAIPARRAEAQAPPAVPASPPTPPAPVAPPVPPVAPPPDAAPAAEERPFHVVLRIYDVDDLIQAVPDRPLGQGVLPPTQLTGTLFGRGFTNPNNTGRQPEPTEQQNMDGLIKLIEEQVASDTWREVGGQVGSISMLQKTLVVRQTEEVQRQVADLLDVIRKSRAGARAVTVNADWLWLSPGELAQVAKPGNAGAPGHEIDPAVLQRLSPKILYAHGQITCAAGQTVHLLSGRVKTIVENLDASVGTGSSAYQPEVDETLDGVALQVTPHVHGESASVDVLAFASGWGKQEQPYRFVPQISGAAPAARPGDADAAANAVASMDRMNVLAQEFCTTAHLPLGKSIVIGGMTLEPEGSGGLAADPKAADGRQLYLVLRVDVD